METHDYRSNKNKPGVELVVRLNNRYGAAKAGDLILVDEEEAKNRSTISACMTEEEIKRLDAERAKREAADAEAKDRRSTKRMFEEGLAKISADGIKQAQDKAMKETLEAERMAAEEAIREEIQERMAKPSSHEKIDQLRKKK